MRVCEIILELCGIETVVTVLNDLLVVVQMNETGPHFGVYQGLEASLCFITSADSTSSGEILH
jgi:hypothetical protein